MTNTIRNGIILFILTAIIATICNYGYAWLAFNITTDATYYTNPDTNQTVINLFFYNSGFRTINELDFSLVDDCNLNWYSPKISDESEICQLKESFLFTGECKKVSVYSGLDIMFKSRDIPSQNCTIKVSYEVNWPGLFFRLSSSDILTKSSHPVTYGDEQIRVVKPQINFSFSAYPIRKDVYRYGRAIVHSIITSNYSGDFILTGEWFNSTSLIDASTLVDKQPHVGRFTLNEGDSKEYYHWTSIVQNIEEASFMGTLKDNNKRTYQEKTEINVINKEELMPYLIQDNMIKFNDTITIFALERILNQTDDKGIAIALLKEVREILSTPKEVSRILYFDENEIDSETVFKDREGTSSEFNVLYISFLRSMGIPAKLENQNNTYYSEVYLTDKGWLPVDVYDSEHIFGQCFINCTNDTPVMIDLR